jgi:tetratricopeptide (TPR) repeat protein
MTVKDGGYFAMCSHRTALGALALTVSFGLVGCNHSFYTSSSDNEAKAASAKAGNKPVGDSKVVPVNHTEKQSISSASPPVDEKDPMAIAEDFYRREEFDKSEEMFSDIADDTKNRPEVAEKARFYHAESLRRLGYYPKAVDAYHKLLLDFPAGLYREQSVEQMYLIASEWLKPIRDEIDDLSKPEEQRRKKSWTESVQIVNFDRKYPTLDTEGRAMQAMERVYFNDPTGVYADKALFILGRVNFHRGEYRESARFFQQLVETLDKSPLRDTALQLAILAKNNSTGGPAYDGRDTADAMRLINLARSSSPELARDKGAMLDEQTKAVRLQQAEKDYETAEFYRRTGHPGSAWFYYELVKRRYPGVGNFAAKATTRQSELKVELNELQEPTVAGTSKRIVKQYVLGHDIDAVKGIPKDDMKLLPDKKAPQDVIPVSMPNDMKPR